MTVDQESSQKPSRSISFFSFFVLMIVGWNFQPANAASPPPVERLEGTIITPASRIAAFIKEPHGNTFLLEVGEDLHGWHVAAIYPGEAVLRAEDGSMLVKTLIGTNVPTTRSLLQHWEPPKFHYEY